MNWFGVKTLKVERKGLKFSVSFCRNLDFFILYQLNYSIMQPNKTNFQPLQKSSYGFLCASLKQLLTLRPSLMYNSANASQEVGIEP